MRRRLFDGPDQGLGEELHLLETVPAPGREGGACSLAACLQVALRAAGQPTTYAQLMGQSGAAFMLRVAEGFPGDLALAGREEYVAPALLELGRQAALTHDPDAPTTFDLCRSETMAGRPALARGWGSNPAEWAVIVGVQGTDLLGHCLGGGGRRERHAPVLTSLLTLGEAVAPLPAPDLVRVALVRAHALLQSAVAQYDVWLALLQSPEPYGPPLSRTQAFLGEQWLSACLADAREAAARYLASLTETASEDFAEALSPAADCAERLAEEAERLLVPPDAIHRAHLPEDLDWRQRRCETLSALRALELKLQDHLRRALREGGNSTHPDE